MAMTVDRYELEIDDLIEWTHNGESHTARVDRHAPLRTWFSNSNLLFEHGRHYDDNTRFTLYSRYGKQV